MRPAEVGAPCASAAARAAGADRAGVAGVAAGVAVALEVRRVAMMRLPGIAEAPARRVQARRFEGRDQPAPALGGVDDRIDLERFGEMDRLALLVLPGDERI